MNNTQSKNINLLPSFIEFKKKKDPVYTLLILLLHVLAWSAFFMLPLLFYPIRFDDRNFFISELAGKIFLIGLFYFNYFVLLPRFLERKKIVAYFSAVVLLVIVAIAQDLVIHQSIWKGGHQFFFQVRRGIAFSDTGSINFSGGNPEFSNSPLFTPPPETTILNIPERYLLMSISKITGLCILLLLIGALIRLGILFIKNQDEKRNLENATLNAELSFLKSQINPHFLFNTLNGIYSQAHERSEKTEISILKLSDLLRYMLYDSGNEKTELSQDIQYINNYIDLQRLRLSSKIKIDYIVKGKMEGHYISPLLLIPFIENAFKHGISYTTPSAIKIHIDFFEETLTLLVENPLLETNTFTSGGLGLKNVMRRLDLLYPGKYLLDIGTTKNLHFVNLKIKLND